MNPYSNSFSDALWHWLTTSALIVVVVFAIVVLFVIWLIYTAVLLALRSFAKEQERKAARHARAISEHQTTLANTPTAGAQGLRGYLGL